MSPRIGNNDANLSRLAAPKHESDSGGPVINLLSWNFHQNAKTWALQSRAYIHLADGANAKSLEGTIWTPQNDTITHPEQSDSESPL